MSAPTIVSKEKYLRGGLTPNAPSIRHEAVDLSSIDYIPRDGGLFRGIFVGGAGDVVIEDIDGVQTTYPLTAGLWALGGRKIVKTGTDATDIIAELDNY